MALTIKIPGDDHHRSPGFRVIGVVILVAVIAVIVRAVSSNQ